MQQSAVSAVICWVICKALVYIRASAAAAMVALIYCWKRHRHNLQSSSELSRSQTLSALADLMQGTAPLLLHMSSAWCQTLWALVLQIYVVTQ